MRAEIVGSGPRVVLVHGSVSGPGAWNGQRELAGRFRLEVLTRPGSPPEPPVKGVGSELPLPDPLPPELEQSARTLMVERMPSEAEIPLAELRTAPFPKLVVSGAHHPAFDAVCDVLERELPAQRVVLPGYGHTVQRAPGFNAALQAFLDRGGSSK